MKMVSRKTIVSYLGRGILIAGVAYEAHRILEQFLFPRSQMYQLALNLVTKHPEAIKYLGEPITDEYIDLDISRCKNSNNSCHFSIPVRGPKATGTIHYLVNIRNTEIRDYYLAEIELFVNNKEKTTISILDQSTPINIK